MNFFLTLVFGLIIQGEEPQMYNVKWACDEPICYIEQQAPLHNVDIDTAINIAFAESGFEPLATNYNKNGTWDKGIYRINDVHNVPDTCRLDFRCNIDWAMDEMEKNGTGAWYSSEHRWR